jgi:hypothetical protein
LKCGEGRARLLSGGLQAGTAKGTRVDVTGARELKARLEARQLRHWQQARAVREGLQEYVDPDADHLVRWRGAVREYEPNPGQRFAKQLVDGRWEISPAGAAA